MLPEAAVLHTVLTSARAGVGRAGRSDLSVYAVPAGAQTVLQEHHPPAQQPHHFRSHRKLFYFILNIMANNKNGRK